MKFYRFGKPQSPVLLLLPGTCCHWKWNFEAVIPLLKERFQVVCVSYDGFDETEATVFPSMQEETEKIETYLLQQFRGHIHAAYGCSLGGSFVGLLIQRGQVRIDHGILGSSDLDQAGALAARLQAGIVAPVLYGILQKGTLPGWMARRLAGRPAEERAYMEKMLAMFGVGKGMPFVKKQSVYNQFYSDLVTPLQDGIARPGTTVHCFYAAKMGEKYLARYRQHFAAPEIRRYDLQHEELLVCRPQQWVKEILGCCGAN